MSSSTNPINCGSNSSIIQGGPKVLGGNGLNSTDSKTGKVASNTLKGSNGPDSLYLSGRVDPSPVGRTWLQFGQLVASYLTLGLVSAPPAPIPRVSSAELTPLNAIPESVGPPVEDVPSTLSNPPPPSTLISRALDAIKSLFTAIYNMLFGLKN